MAQKARKPQVAKNGPKKAHPCDQCETSFDGPAELKRHIDAVHLGLKPHKCTQCDEAFSHKGHENAFVCEQCNKKFASKQVMTEHIESVHEGIRHKCDFCDYTSPFRNRLNAHIRKKH